MPPVIQMQLRFHWRDLLSWKMNSNFYEERRKCLCSSYTINRFLGEISKMTKIQFTRMLPFLLIPKPHFRIRHKTDRVWTETDVEGCIRWQPTQLSVRSLKTCISLLNGQQRCRDRAAASRNVCSSPKEDKEGERERAGGTDEKRGGRRKAISGRNSGKPWNHIQTTRKAF